MSSPFNFFFFNDTATTEIYTLSLHDALPIYPSGLRNSATTAYQSASPPMVAASANAATKPKIGCTGSSAFAVTNRVSVPASTSVASALTRRNSAARAASPGASNEDVPDELMGLSDLRGGQEDSSFRHCERSEAIHRKVCTPQL